MAAGTRSVMSFFVMNQVLHKHVLGMTTTLHRLSSTSTITAKKLMISEFGDPAKVVKLEEEQVNPPRADEVLVKMLFTPVNPADINTIQGTYAVKPTLPAVVGIEGLAEVLLVGPQIKNVNVGDRVVFNREAAGTWRTHGLFKEADLLKVPSDVDELALSGIMSNPSTAYRMLKDFVKLIPGDVVIQNGGNSAAGQNVIQLCKAWGITSVSIVRNRPDIAQLEEYLKELGTTHVLIEEDVRKAKIFDCIPKPKLALNCVGGKNATEMMRHLAPKGIMVTYGGMSREPVTIPTSLFIFKSLQFHGYWMTRWSAEHRNTSEQREMVDDLISLIRSCKLRAPAHKKIALKNYCEAIGNTMTVKGFTGMKYFIDYSLS